MTQENQCGIENLSWPHPRIVTSEPIKVVGVGGFGNEMVDQWIRCRGKHVGAVFIDADLDELEQYSDRPTIKLQIADKKISTPGEAQAAAEAAHQHIRQALGGAQMVFIVSALGGVTGSGATAVVARIADEIGILTMCTFTYPHDKNPPFPRHFANNAANAEYGLVAIRQTRVTVNPLGECRRTAFWGSESERSQIDDCQDDIELYCARYSQSFHRIREEISEGLTKFIAAVVEMVVVGFHCTDIEDLRYVMKRPGVARIGVSTCGGKNRLKLAIKSATKDLQTDFEIENASAVFLAISGSANEISIGEQSHALRLLRKKLHPEAHISYGYVCVPKLEDMLSVFVLAVGPNTSAS